MYKIKYFFNFVGDSIINMESFEKLLPVAVHEGKLVVFATDLHGYLDGWAGTTKFSEWFWGYVHKHSFTDGLDYDWLSPVSKSYTDYALSMNMAKIIALLDDPDYGSEVRRYLSIQEKEFEMRKKQKKSVEVLPLVVNNLVQQEKQNGGVVKESDVKNQEKADSPWD